MVPVQKNTRIRKACDSCNIKRTKCNGQQPCLHCSHMKLECTYLRKERKRGRASDKYPKKIRKRKPKELENGLNKADPLQPPISIQEFSPLNGKRIRSLSKRDLLSPVMLEIDKFGLPVEVAEDLLDFYFGDVLFPPTNVFSILRPSMVLTGRRKLSSTLLLAILLTSMLHIDHPYFGETRRVLISQKLYGEIEKRLSCDPAKFEYDDLLSTLHIGYLMPWITYPLDILRWWPVGCKAMKHLILVTHGVDEEQKEEQRRTWLSVYLWDRLISFSFNEKPMMEDEEFTDIIIPCDEVFWMMSDLTPRPAETDPMRPTFQNYHGFSPGIYGLFLPLAKILGLIFNYKRDSHNKDVLERVNELLKLHNSHIQSAEKFARGKTGIPDSHIERFRRDLLYAKFISLSIEFMKQFIVDHGGNSYTIICNFDSDIHHHEYRILVHAVEVLEQLIKMDPEMRWYPYTLSIFLFAIGYAVFLILNNMEKEDATNTKKINKLKYLVKVLVRTMEIVLIPFPAVFLKTLRNILVRSLQDCEKLILLTDHFDQFKENAEQRKEALSAFNWLPDKGKGLAI